MEPAHEEHSPEQQARRHLLKLAAYTPPAILGAMLASSKLAQAATVGQTQNCGGGTTIVVSASGYACCPCVPSSNKYDPNRCNQARCQLGNCSACRQLVFTNQSQCQSTTAACGSCTCTPVGGGGGGSGRGKRFWVCQ